MYSLLNSKPYVSLEEQKVFSSCLLSLFSVMMLACFLNGISRLASPTVWYLLPFRGHFSFGNMLKKKNRSTPEIQKTHSELCTKLPDSLSNSCKVNGRFPFCYNLKALSIFGRSALWRLSKMCTSFKGFQTKFKTSIIYFFLSTHLIISKSNSNTFEQFLKGVFLTCSAESFSGSVRIR